VKVVLDNFPPQFAHLSIAGGEWYITIVTIDSID